MMVLMPAMMQIFGREPGSGSSDRSCAPATYVFCTFRTASWRCEIDVLWWLHSRLPEVGAGGQRSAALAKLGAPRELS
jgi:hypothetical protein